MTKSTVAVKIGPVDAVSARTAVKPVRQGRLRSTGPVLVTRVGLQIPPELTYDGWEQAGKRIAEVVDSSAWCLGDWLLYGQTRYSDRYRRAVEAVGLDYQTIRNYVWVARRFELPRRRTTLSFQHHAEVAAMSDTEQDCWLDRAEEGGWSRNELRRRVRAAAKGLAPDELPVSAIPRLNVQPERIERWRTAAELSERSLESWIVSCLDAQAATVLGQQDAPQLERAPTS